MSFEYLSSIDLRLFNFLELTNLDSLSVDILIAFLAKYLGYIIILLIIIQLLSKRKAVYSFWHQSLFLAMALIIGRGILTEIIRFFIDSTRPFVALGLEPIIGHAATASFPSGHAVLFFTIAFSFVFLKNKFWPYYFISAILIAVARVISGVHWPSDILGGVLVALIGSVVTFYLFKKVPKLNNLSDSGYSA